ncbi:hypothetical protein HYV79_04230 [Candidatus Woesearchaeota archaeon]|nr:hypothetical protein [Candidatus Woesearchaeota archaeon]
MVEQEFQKLVGEILVLSNDLEQELGYIKELNLVEQEIKLKNLRLEFIYICEHFINHIRDARLNRLGEPLLGLLRVVNELNTLIKTAQELKTKKYKNCATKKINNLLGIFIKKSSYAILILKELDQKIGVLSQQYYIQVNVAPYKKIRLRIVYEPAIKTAIFLEKKVYFEIADYAKNIGKNINEIISEINKKLENSVKIVFGSDVVESVFGGVFEKNLEIYIIKKYGEKGFVSRLKKAFGRHKDIIEFQPDSNDMRIFFDIQFILNNGSEKIASTLLHELTHVLDKHAFSKTKMWHILYSEKTLKKDWDNELDERWNDV